MKIFPYTVVPNLPKALEPLRELAWNLWWSWHREATDLFVRMDEDLWEATEHNPIRMLAEISQERLSDLAADDGFCNHLSRVLRSYRAYHAEERRPADSDMPRDLRVAYFSFEFALHESLPIYSGGLGVLAGDHLKSASDLDIPLVGVGLLYRERLVQYSSSDGWQQEEYPSLDFYSLPVEPVQGSDRRPLTFTLHLLDHAVTLQVWRLRVGRVQLYFLDSNLPENTQEDRDITARLYGGDLENRIRQEIILGIGGMRALRLLDLEPTVCHINEGHAAFLALERIRVLMREGGLDFHQAREIVSASTLFTTHTPVPAGNDVFDPGLVMRYFSQYARELGISDREFIDLGRQDPFDTSENFCLTVLALRLSNHCNGVSCLHGKVSRRLWQRIWPGVPTREVPISWITNGVHSPSWLSKEMTALLERYLGHRWQDAPDNPAAWAAVHRIPDAELWHTHQRRRARLVAFVRRRLRETLIARSAPSQEIAIANEVLDPEALTIGFARRFATYKRATLIFRDPERLARILEDKDRPVQIIFAGKAHPHDKPGKELIKKILSFARQERFRRHLVFLWDYDMNIARYLAQGVDLWLNNPRRPLEASGTSGMKIALNGGLNMSVLDGWWDEAYSPEIGWAIGLGEVYDDLELQDDNESRAIYDMLEREVIPSFYDRTADDLPRLWISRMKTSLQSLSPFFNTHRMVREYYQSGYLPAHRVRARLLEDDSVASRELARWRRFVQENWKTVQILTVRNASSGEVPLGTRLAVEALVSLGPLSPKDVQVEAYTGPLNHDGEIEEPVSTPLRAARRDSDEWLYQGEVPCERSGRCGLTVRVVPHHADLVSSFVPGCIAWA